MEKELLKALIAIKQRINGEFDGKELQEFGCLSTDVNEDVLQIIESVINE